MPTLSKTKVEQLGIDKIANIVDGISNATHNLKTFDREIALDGKIDFYKNSDVDSKKNYDYSINVQVKGRSRHGKKPFSSFALSLGDLEIMLKNWGAILFVVSLFDDGRMIVSYAQLLPYELRNYIKAAKSNIKKRTNVKLKAIDEKEESQQVEKICKSFNLHRQYQIKAPDIAYDGENLEQMESVVILAEHPSLYGNIKNSLGTETYAYKLGENKIPVKVLKIILNQAEVRNTGIALTDKDKKYHFNLDSTITKSKTILHYKDIFQINLTENSFTYSIKGTIKERIYCANFIKATTKTKNIYINETKIPLDFKEEDYKAINKICSTLNKLLENSQKLRIEKDINLDRWNDVLIDKFINTSDAIINGAETHTDYDKSFFATFSLADLNLTYMHLKTSEHMARYYDVLDFNDKKHAIELTFDDKIKSSNMILAMTQKKYESDNFSVALAENYIINNPIKKNDAPLFSNQVLTLIRAYDNTNNVDFLDLANIIINQQRKVYDSPEVIINKLQIDVRLRKDISESAGKLIEIKNATDNPLIEICCDILLQNKIEARHKILKLDKESKKNLEEFPIYKLL